MEVQDLCCNGKEGLFQSFEPSCSAKFGLVVVDRWPLADKSLSIVFNPQSSLERSAIWTTHFMKIKLSLFPIWLHTQGWTSKLSPVTVGEWRTSSACEWEAAQTTQALDIWCTQEWIWSSVLRSWNLNRTSWILTCKTPLTGSLPGIIEWIRADNSRKIFRSFVCTCQILLLPTIITFSFLQYCIVVWT